MKDKHPAKVKLARQIITPDETKSRVSIFSSKAWEERKAERAAQVIEREKAAKISARVLREAKNEIRSKSKVEAIVS